MEVYQYYYTSYIQKSTGHAGFQVKALSPGISSELQALLMRHIAYRIPPLLAADAPETHPISLRYFFLPSGQSILLCSQSSGKDEYGRPGNFFVHAVILETQHFISMPAIFFWKSTFWQNHDAQNRDEIASLPVLNSFDEEPTMDSEHIWHFVAQGDRRRLLAKLLCAIVQNHTTQRRIVILDTDEHVALWIAAVSCLLPPEYRPLLTFATYHHDPQQAQYLITGTFKHASLRLELSPSYFILDAETGKTSSVEASPYAEFAAKAARPERYETDMLPIFADFTRRFPVPQCIDEQLDLLALYASIQYSTGEVLLTSAIAHVIHSALPSFETLLTYNQEDIDELCQIARVLRKTDAATPQSTLHEDYSHVLTLLKIHHSSFFDDLLLEALQQLTEQRLTQLHDSFSWYISRLYQLYTEQAVIDALNGLPYLAWLTQHIQEENFTVHTLTHFWINLGSFIQPDESYIPLLLHTSFTHMTLNQQQTKETHMLLEAMVQAMNQQKYAWLQLIIAHHNAFPHMLVKILYLSFVAHLPLEERLPYRALVLPQYHKILCDELCTDIHAAPLTQCLTILECWIEHARSQHYAIDELIQAGIDQLHQESASEQEWQSLAGRILLNEHLVPLPQSTMGDLVPVALSLLSMTHFTPTEHAICVHYGQLASLSSSQKELAANIVALTNGCMTSDQAKQVNLAIAYIPAEAYGSLLDRCLPLFFLNIIPDEVHVNLIEALLPHAIQLSITHDFWQRYLQTLDTLCQQLTPMNQGVEILDFWFRTSPDAFSIGYPVQQFFLFLSTSNIIQKNYIAMIKQEAGMMTRPWYPTLQHEKRSSRFSLIGNSLRGREGKQTTGSSEEQQRFKDQGKKQIIDIHILDKEIRSLFTHMAESEQYHKLMEMYEVCTPGQFWLCYWKHFSRLLAERDVDRLYALLSFWFDHSYEVLGTIPYLPQDFFLSLPGALKSALRTRDIEKIMQRLREKARQEVQQENEQTLSQHWFSALISLYTW